MARSRVALAGFATIVAVVLVALATGAPSADAAGTCETSDVHNTVRVDADALQGRVTGGSLLNGSAGYAWFRDLPTDGPHTLVGPEGISLGPRDPLGGSVVFGDVPFCFTGDWHLVSMLAGEVVASFRTAEDPAGPLDQKTVAIDEPAPSEADRHYYAGHVDQAYTIYEGPTRVVGYPPAQPLTTRVNASWSFDPSPAWEDRDRVRVTVAAEGENQTAITTVETTGGSGNISTVVDWQSPDAARVLLMGRGYDDDGYGLEGYSTSTRHVFLLPGSPPPG